MATQCGEEGKEEDGRGERRERKEKREKIIVFRALVSFHFINKNVVSVYFPKKEKKNTKQEKAKHTHTHL